MNRQTIARIAHEINRAYCASQGDLSVQPWSKASQEQRDSMEAGVDMHLANATSSPQAQHEAWMAAKAAAGWKFGEVKDEAAKTHPAMVPYDKLDPVQKAKDWIFKMVVAQLSPLAQAPADRVSVKYIGHGGNRATHRDNLYGTEMIWRYGESLMVPTKIAEIMLAMHPQVYGPGDPDADAPAIPEKPAEDEEFMKLQAIHDTIANMSKADVVGFVKTNYRQTIAAGTVAEMRQAAMRVVDQFGVD